MQPADRTARRRDALADPPALELVVNLQTARGLGLTIPAPVLRQATEVISC